MTEEKRTTTDALMIKERKLWNSWIRKHTARPSDRRGVKQILKKEAWKGNGDIKDTEKKTKKTEGWTVETGKATSN